MGMVQVEMRIHPLLALYRPCVVDMRACGELTVGAGSSLLALDGARLSLHVAAQHFIIKLKSPRQQMIVLRVKRGAEEDGTMDELFKRIKMQFSMKKNDKTPASCVLVPRGFVLKDAA